MCEPYIEDGWLVEPCEPDYAPGISQAIPGSWSKPLVDLTELDGWDELIAAAEQRGKERTEQSIYELTEAIRFTVEYVGNDTLPPINGWSWFDALRKYRPELAEHFEQNPQLRPDNHVTRKTIADQIQDRADRMEGDE